jgi:hypothetical protein
MKWSKKGKICDAFNFDLPWFKKNTMVPLPYLMSPDRLRIFVTMCDEHMVGRIGYVDVNPQNPSQIIGHSKKPLIDIGSDGTFDDNGVVTASLLKEGNALYMYYSSYQSTVKVPYLIYTGVAVSHDNGETFTKISKQVPMLDRVDGEVSTRCVPYVLKEGNTYRMWYTADSGSGWITDATGKKKPLYDLKYLSSTSPVDWPRQQGEVALSFKDSDEHGIAKCTVWKQDGIYKIIYSIRSLSQQYRLGYGESKDGLHFVRKDSEVGIDVSPDGWDSEMIAFAERCIVGNKTYLFYCGNGYGYEGIGYAELVN